MALIEWDLLDGAKLQDRALLAVAHDRPLIRSVIDSTAAPCTAPVCAALVGAGACTSLRGAQVPLAAQARTWAAISRIGANQTSPVASIFSIIAWVWRQRARRPDRNGCHTGTHSPPYSRMAS